MPKSVKHRSFTVRMPIETYLEVASLALAEEVPMNNKVNQLVRLGLGKHISLDQAIKRLLGEKIMLEENTDGKA